MKSYGLRTTTDPVEFVLSNSWIAPADVQRDYQWGEGEVLALWDDISSFARGGDAAAGEVYFLGMIIVHGGDARYAIFDGLQRITTLTILICLLRDVVAPGPLRERLAACVCDLRGAPRLTLLGQQYLATHIQPPGQSTRLQGGRLAGQAEALRRAQSVLRDEVRALDEPARERLSRVLLEQVIMARLMVDSPKLANRVFQAMNMRGLTLEDADLIKSRLAEFPGTEAEIEALLTQWRTIRQTLTSRSQARVEQAEESHKYDRYSGFQGFVLALEMMERGIADRREARLEPVDRIEGFVDWMKARHGSANGLMRYLGFVERCAENWNLMNQPAMGGASSPFRPLLPIRSIWWTEWKPLALRIMGLSFQDQAGGAAWRRGLFDQMHRAAMAMDLAGFSPQKRHLVFAKAIGELSSDARPARLAALEMRDEDVVRIYRALSAPLTNYHLRRSLILWAEYIHAAPDYRMLGQVSVEHILPQSTVPAAAWLEAFPNLDQRDQLMHLAGNLVLVPNEINRALGDTSFEEKRARLNRRAAELEGLHLVDWVRARKDWTPQHIMTRTHELVSQIWDALGVSQHPFTAYGEQRR
ncbi:MAG: DUF262 domain-containing HNH endonuclease family protein [Pseudomonadota bacterium]